MKLRRALLMPLLLFPLVAGTVIVTPANAAAAPEPRSAAPVPLVAAAAASGDTAANGIFTGKAFDTCAAPSTKLMQQWRTASPYRAVGIYIGGVNRSCAQPNLNAAWISTVHAQGWFTLPIYVGLQAPCTNSSRKFGGSAAAIGAQGSAAAADAVRNMSGLGLGTGNPIYLDIENYDRTIRGCSAATKVFLSSFVGGVKARGYLAGVYGGAASITADLVGWIKEPSFRRPDAVWYARWDGRATTSGEKSLPDSLWASHRRVHQYEIKTLIYGGSTRLTVDSNAVDSYVTGAKVRMTVSSARTVLGRAASVPVVTGGTAPYSVAITSGSLPAGLRFSSGRLVGTPTQVGSHAVALKISDSGSPRRAVIARLTVAVYRTG